MSGRTELTLEDSRGFAWKGYFRRDLDVLDGVFRHIVDINLERLRRTPETIPEVWQAMMPTTVKIERFLSPLAVHLSVLPKAVSTASVASMIGSGPPSAPKKAESSATFESETSDLSAGFVVRISPPMAPSAGGWFSSFWRASPARRAYDVAHRIRAFGLVAPRPLGFLERIHSPARSLSFSAFEFVPGPSLYEVRERLRASGDFEAKRAFIDRFAGAVRALHERGMTSGSFRLAQFLLPEDDNESVAVDGSGVGIGGVGSGGVGVNASGGGAAVGLSSGDDRDGVVLVDLESVRVGRLRRREQVLLLADLEREFARNVGFTRTDRMRFMRTYLLHQGGSSRASRRQLWTFAAREVDPLSQSPAQVPESRSSSRSWSAERPSSAS
ncbi:MAG: hypothetical protein H6729_17420 [Deltaproteobacteria bacterium]|nr:hypothetical protein [Deltaproteobacteria bacterium]